MCVIAIKPVGIELPAKNIIRNMWDNNYDGGGFMYAMNGQVHINKGFMKLRHFNKALRSMDKKYNTKNISMILHFRIGTHGKNSPENTHPFPVSGNINDLRKLNFKTDLAVAHNGVINIKPSIKGISDTMEYIIKQLDPLYRLDPNFYKKEAGKEIIHNAINSKMVFMDGQGNIETVGDFIKDKSGVLYSNTSYLYNYKKFTYSYVDRSYYNYKPYKKLLMWVENGYVILGNSQIDEGYTYLIDMFKTVYKYDIETDTCYEIEAEAFSPQGVPLQWDHKYAELMKIEGDDCF